MKKRILVLLSVVALMVVMVAMAVGPAFAPPEVPIPKGKPYVCTDAFGDSISATREDAKDYKKNPALGVTCEKLRDKG